jgi:UDP-N-acetylmuramoyl-tripeptide--D-alanyl-D-alanine ligase
MFIYVLIVLAFVLATFFKTKRSLHMLQQNLYNENNRYFKWIIKNFKQFISLDLFGIAIALIGLFVIYDLDNINMLALSLIIILYIVIAAMWINFFKHDQNKKPLVVTKRIKRLIVTLIILYIIPVVILGGHIEDTRFCWMMILIMTIMIYLNSIIVFIANIINTPIEKLVYLHFKKMAQDKLNSMPNLKIIGITGSYGKTSSKNILGEILNIKYNALPTPKNLNTYNGLIMTVNNKLDKFTDIFIAEMGAYVKGEIKGLCNLVHPKYGILTRIGTAHLETFGSEQNIIDGKFELIESLPQDGFGILNGDDPKQVNYKLKNKVKIIWIGIDNRDVDVRATNIKCSSTGTTFDVIFKGDKKKYPFTTKLLGNHNVYNILASIACGREFGISAEELEQAVRMVKPIEHRLELKRLGNFYQIDDAYNSNPIGAENACKVLGMMPGLKVVVTPGMIELGEKEAAYNRKFGEQIAEVADIAILIGEEHTKPIKEGLITKGFEPDKIIVYNDVRDAFKYIYNLKDKKGVYALFENDLPDTYNE